MKLKANIVKKILATALICATLAVIAGIASGRQVSWRSSLLSTGGGTDIAVTDIDGDGLDDVLAICVSYAPEDEETKLNPHKKLIIFTQESGGFKDERRITVNLPLSAMFVFAADIAPESGLEIAYIAPDGVWAVSLRNRVPGKPKKVIDVDTPFPIAAAGDLYNWPYIEDFDADGRTDIIVPVPSGYRVYYQTARGVFDTERTSDIKVEISADIYSGNSFISSGLTLPNLTFVDLDGDGAKDIIGRGIEDIFVYYRRGEGFERRSTKPDDYSIRKRIIRDAIDISTYRFDDVNGDGMADLLVATTGGEIGAFESIDTKLILYLGRPGSLFSDTPTQIIRVTGVCLSPELVDLTGDGRLDLIATTFRTDLLSLAGSSIQVNYSFREFDAEKSEFERTGFYSWTEKVEMSGMDKTSAVPLVHARGDFNGDGIIDLMSVTDKYHYGVRAGRRNGEGRLSFDDDHTFSFAVASVTDIIARDINGDGIVDLVSRRGREVSVSVSGK